MSTSHNTMDSVYRIIKQQIHKAPGNPSVRREEDLTSSSGRCSLVPYHGLSLAQPLKREKQSDKESNLQFPPASCRGSTSIHTATALLTTSQPRPGVAIRSLHINPRDRSRLISLKAACPTVLSHPAAFLASTGSSAVTQ